MPENAVLSVLLFVLLLQAKHFVCDGPLQTKVMVHDKGIYGQPLGLLHARTALVFNTANTPVEREMQVFGDPLETLWKNCVFGLCGVDGFHRRVFGVIVTSTAEQRAAWLKEVQDVVERHFSFSA